jgi:hypothetical protein
MVSLASGIASREVRTKLIIGSHFIVPCFCLLNSHRHAAYNSLLRFLDRVDLYLHCPIVADWSKRSQEFVFSFLGINNSLNAQ